MRHDFPKAQRLRRNIDVTHVLNQAQRCKEDHVTLLYRPNNKGSARLGICVGKRQARLAVTRNRIKRLVRESFRCCPIKLQSLDIVILTQKGVADKTNKEIIASLGILWDKLIIRCSKAA